MTSKTLRTHNYFRILISLDGISELSIQSLLLHVAKYVHTVAPVSAKSCFQGAEFRRPISYALIIFLAETIFGAKDCGNVSNTAGVSTKSNEVKRFSFYNKPTLRLASACLLTETSPL